MKYFGTDGIRGRVGQYPMTVDFVLKVGWAIGQVLKEHGGDKVVIGKDTRITGYMIEAALEAGLSAAGINVYLLGPIPTPAISYLTGTLRAQIGIVISASHNLFQDNGIKLFWDNGEKLSDEFQQKIENFIDQPIVTNLPRNVGKVARIDDAKGRYIEYCKSCVPHFTNFKGVKLVVDCANGAAYSVAPNVFSELQAEVTQINCHPNGTNINEKCGSTYPEYLRSKVISEQADLGIALDGDGDRLILVDHLGEIVDGDEILYIIACEKSNNKRLVGGVVGTVMSSIGLELSLEKKNIPFKRVQVGDKYILQALMKEGWQLGGESSGHVICLDLTPTGDGIITALQILLAMKWSGKNLHQLKSGMIKTIQITKNIPCDNNKIILQNNDVQTLVALTHNKLQPDGRVLLRASGTEPVLRLTVEGKERKIIEEVVHKLFDEISRIISNY